jgi:23S rRNA pseudouridine1911/1915/1917 synthase
MFATDHPEKVYRAIVCDPDRRWLAGARATLTTPLGLLETRVRVRMGRGDLASTTHVEVVREVELGRFGRGVDLQIQIETGRQHQIRAHLALEGTRIAGDKLYSHDDEFFMAIHDDPDNEALRAQLPFDRHALHAWRITIPHPEHGRPIRAEAPLPAFFEAEPDIVSG